MKWHQLHQGYINQSDLSFWVIQFQDCFWYWVTLDQPFRNHHLLIFFGNWACVYLWLWFWRGVIQIESSWYHCVFHFYTYFWTEWLKCFCWRSRGLFCFWGRRSWRYCYQFSPLLYWISSPSRIWPGDRTSTLNHSCMIAVNIEFHLISRPTHRFIYCLPVFTIQTTLS